MSGDMKKRLIFTIYTKVEEDDGFWAKRNYVMNQFETYFDKLVGTIKKYASHCNAEFKLLSPSSQHYDDLNVYKIQQWENFCEDYDEVLFLDLDIIINTEKNIFEYYDFNKFVGVLLETPISRFVYSKEDLDNQQEFYQSLDKYHWLVKTKQYHHMLMSQFIMPKTEWMMNTAVFGGNKNFRNKLKFTERLSEHKQVIDEIKDMDDRYFYNNEIIMCYSLERYELMDEVQRLPTHWYGDVFTDSDLRLCKTHYFNHIYSKDFGPVFKILGI